MNLLKLSRPTASSPTKILAVSGWISALILLMVPRAEAAGEYTRLKALVVVYTNTFAGTVDSRAES